MLLITLIMTFMAASASFHTGIGKTHTRGIIDIEASYKYSRNESVFVENKRAIKLAELLSPLHNNLALKL